MPEHTIGTREEQRARDELAKLEAEQAELDQKATERRRQPGLRGEGVRVYTEKEEDPRRLSTAAPSFSPTTSCSAPITTSARPELLDGGDELGATLVHSEPPRRDGDLLLACADRSAHRLQGADGLQFHVSTNGTDFPSTMGLPSRPSRRGDSRGRETLENPPEWLEEWGRWSEPSSRTACART